jgi:ubiquinone/menaquinone biosynthesis C-methylase UbiE
MLALARSNQTKSIETNNISFIESNITSIPLEDGIADCIISNCVINLVPEADKPTVFAEMGRLIKSGGRVAISDILARKTLPAKVRESVALYVGCIAGASRKEDYTQFLKDGGFRGK